MTIDRADAITSMPRTFVVPLDGSDFAARAIPIADELGARFDACLVLATVPTPRRRRAPCGPDGSMTRRARCKPPGSRLRSWTRTIRRREWSACCAIVVMRVS